MIRIAIADDQVLFRDMLSIILMQEPSFEVIGTAGNGNEMMELCSQKRPDMVLLDVRMPVADGISALIRIKALYPEIKVIMLTTFEEEEYMLKACVNAADGYILKDTKPETLVNTVKCVRDGLFVMHPSVQQLMMRQISENDTIITPRILRKDALGFDSVDMKIVKLITQGKSNSEISQVVNYSEGTVKNRVSRLLDLTELKDRTQLAIFALQNGLV